MKKLTKKEVQTLELESRNGKKYQPFLDQAKSLKRGEAVFISKEDWEATGLKSQPSQYASTMLKQLGLNRKWVVKTERLTGGRGWAIIRKI